jgi:hypothetical protein
MQSVAVADAHDVTDKPGTQRTNARPRGSRQPRLSHPKLRISTLSSRPSKVSVNKSMPCKSNAIRRREDGCTRPQRSESLVRMGARHVIHKDLCWGSRWLGRTFEDDEDSEISSDDEKIKEQMRKHVFPHQLLGSMNKTRKLRRTDPGEKKTEHRNFLDLSVCVILEEPELDHDPSYLLTTSATNSLSTPPPTP